MISQYLSMLSGAIATLLIGFPASTLAQTNVVSDGTTNTAINSSINQACLSGVCQIDGGVRVNDSLFHSFQTFSISSGDEAQFESNGIDRIFTRVTGGQISSIDGLISTTGSETDLFLINPSGIIFGPDARLEISGSFITSTANRILFDNGATFDASQTAFPSDLLTINVPVGLQYGSSPSSITVQGDGNNLAIDPDTFGVDRSNRPAGLSIGAGQTLALLGGPIQFQGGNVTAEAGLIEVSAVGANAEIGLSPQDIGWQFQYDDVRAFDTIHLSQAASLDASGEGGGAIQVWGDRLIVQDGSVMISNTLGQSSGQGLTINTSNRVVVKGSSDTGSSDTGSSDIGSSDTFPSSLFSDVALGATGDGGSIRISTPLLKVIDSAQLSASTLGDGGAGTIDLDTQAIRMRGIPSSLIVSGAGPSSTGQGGNIRINTDQLSLADGAQIVTTTFGEGNAGNLSVTAQTIHGEGVNAANGLGSALNTIGFLGRGGNIVVNTQTLTLETGAFISTGTFGSGDSGNVNITANAISLSGLPPAQFSNPDFIPSSIGSAADINTSGRGGTLIIHTHSLEVKDGATINSSTFGSGDAGAIEIYANSLSVTGVTTDQIRPSSIFSLVEETSSGQGNDISIQVNDLLVQGGGQIATGTSSIGNGGELVIEAETITLDGAIRELRSGLFANAIASTGNGGDLIVNANHLRVENGATINVGNFQSQGFGEPGQGAAGSIFLNVPVIQLNNNGRLLADTAAGNEGDLVFQTDILVLSHDSQISTNAGSADGGNIKIDAEAIATLTNSDITANAEGGFGGQVLINADGLFGTAFRPGLTSNSDITASSALGSSFSGEVVINTPDVDPSRGFVDLPETLVDVSSQITTACEQIDENTLVLAGTGGIPQNPHQSLLSQSIWPDLRWNFVNEHGAETTQRSSDRLTGVSLITEAQGLSVNANGQIVLVQATPIILEQHSSCDHSPSIVIDGK